jgi:multicomponent Na+:H+ antiporter subunit F
VIEPAVIIQLAADAALAVLGLSLLLTAWRIAAGPTLPDRIAGLDMLTGIAIGFIAVVAVKTGFALYIDIAVSLGLVGFLATVAFARFVLSRGMPAVQPEPDAAAKQRKAAKAKTKVKAAKPGRAR